MSESRDGMATVFRSSDHNAEIEAEMIMGILQASGVEVFAKGLDVLPGAHEVEVMVAQAHLAQAERLIAEAQQGGPAAAEAGERASEEKL
jgi:Putative prokaryotic signal transducing protein